MISNTLGAVLGGTTRGGQYGLESAALSLMTPPNGMGWGGSCFPSIVVVASGEPRVPVVCICAVAEDATAMMAATEIAYGRMYLFDLMFSPFGCFFVSISPE